MNKGLGVLLAASLLANAGLALTVWEKRRSDPVAPPATAAAKAPEAVQTVVDPGYFKIWSTPLVPSVKDLKLPSNIFVEKRIFNRRVDYGVAEWSPFNELPIVAPILPSLTPEARRLLMDVPRVSHDMAGLEALFRWFRGCQWGRCMSVMAGLGGLTKADHVYCDQSVSIMRTLLMARGFLSRTVVFEFADGHGGDSHTFAEVWMEELGQWIYVDPFNGAYSPHSSAAQLVGEAARRADLVFVDAADDDGGHDARRRENVARLFNEGWHLWFVENGMVGLRLKYQDPEIYREMVVEK